MRLILDTKYEKAGLSKDIETRCQSLIITKCNELLKIITEIRRVVQWNTWHLKKEPLDIKLNEDTKPIWSRPYPVPKVHEEMFKKEVEFLVLLGVFEAPNYSE